VLQRYQDSDEQTVVPNLDLGTYRYHGAHFITVLAHNFTLLAPHNVAALERVLQRGHPLVLDVSIGVLDFEALIPKVCPSSKILKLCNIAPVHFQL
jgi:hypothetical protein